MSNSSSKSSEVVASPCRRQCCLDDQDVCLGCGRRLAEILEWGQAPGSRRREICQAALLRLRPGLKI
ncbi:MAG: DUF1289 domain-containing protein [Pseudomonas sp.]